MAIDRRRLSIYLDELDVDPVRACMAARSLGFDTVCLRRVWSTNITKANDEACKRIKSALSGNNLSVLAICGEDGRIAPGQLAHDQLAHDQLAREQQALQRSIAIAAYFKAKLLRVYVGIREQGTYYSGQINDQHFSKVSAWMADVASACKKALITPVIEIDHDSLVFDPADVAALLTQHAGWQLLYDPAQLIIKRNQDPLVRYWYLLRQQAAAIDLHDFKIGHGFVSIGTGDCRIEDTIRDCLLTSFGGWFILEPGVFRRSIVTSRHEVVNVAIANFVAIVERCRTTITAWQTEEKQHGKKRTR